MHRLSLLVLRFPLSAAIVVSCLSMAALAGVARLTFDDGLRTTFAGSSPEYRRYEDHRRRFTEADFDIAVLFRSDGFDDPAKLEAVRDFALEANFASGVGETFSLFSLRSPPDENGDTSALLPADFPEAGALAALLDGLRLHPMGGDRLVSADRKSTLVLVSQVPEASGVEPSRATLADLRTIAEEAIAGQTIKVSVAGLAPLRQIVIDGMLRDTITLNVIGIAIGLAVCFLAVRSPRLALLTAIPPTFALCWVLGIMGWLGLSINTVTNAVPVLLLVLAFADSLHLTFEVRRGLPDPDPVSGAIAAAARRIGPACVMTSFTTAIAFSALLISDSELVRSLGRAGALATLISLITVLCIHPLTFFAAAHMKATAGLFRVPSPRAFAPLQAKPLYLAGFRAHRAITVAALAGLAAALAIYATIRPVYSFLENIDETNPALVAMHDLERDLAPTGSIDIEVRLPAGDPIGMDGLADIALVHEAVEAAAPDSVVLSLANVARWVGGTDGKPDPAVLAGVLDRMSGLQRGRFLSADGTTALVRLYISDKGSRATRALVARLRGALRSTGLPPERLGPPTGLLAMSASVSERMIGHLNVSFVIAVAASGLFIGLWFRNWRYGLVSLVPNILPIACVGAFLAITGWGLQFSSAIAMTIAFGIAVDDTIHVINRLRLEAPPGDPFNRRAVRKAYHDIAPILTITTAVLSFGMLGSQLSSIPTIAYFGALVIVVFVLALLAVMVILPACLFTLGRPESD